jgi:hypothetical protein
MMGAKLSVKGEDEIGLEVRIRARFRALPEY